jgi:hypothetical protein
MRMAKTQFIFIALALILIFILSDNNSFYLVYGQINLQAIQSPCLICFYTVEDKSLEIGLIPRRAGTPLGDLNVDFTQLQMEILHRHVQD